ncbi:ATP-binding cassette domain-containing protein [Phreatobacter cathodiphilus]|uniref:ABC transporter ATP-binding protein n=1 Tax=Phreatobacter cathodiphilus TaxID=1868589 RepID=A0A2S0NG39_9HYPH|nr:ATP-binding cassette domain-containing protein [Phreatobacter cathodiphilus]AVO47006.1 ABC transporter ATP-binding protein [Phreatobacter cathodiphilus]
MRDTPSILPLTVTDLVFEAGGRRLVDRIGFTVARGGLTVLIGPNGSGKSLTLRLCHGLLTPAAGTVSWAAELGTIAGVKRHAMVFQKPVMLRRSARANILHALAAAGLGRGERAERCAEALERFGLGVLADRPARLMSGGEQQRLAIARAWALRPQVLFLDEPTSQLDPGATRQIEEMLAALRGEGMTLVMATHDMGQARRLADRVLFLHRGRLVEDAEAHAFFTGPDSPEARAFIAGDIVW